MILLINNFHEYDHSSGLIVKIYCRNDFRDYVDICFKEFGDRVKHWITLNEQYIFITSGYVFGNFAPGRCSSWQPFNCLGGDSATEPYIVGHNQILSHATAVKVYKTKYQVIS